MARYAILRNSIVENVAEWNSDTATWQPPQGTTAIACPNGVGPGYTYDGTTWTAPAAPVPTEPFDFSRFSPREFLQALVDNSVISAAKRDAVLNLLKK